MLKLTGFQTYACLRGCAALAALAFSPAFAQLTAPAPPANNTREAPAKPQPAKYTEFEKDVYYNLYLNRGNGLGYRTEVVLFKTLKLAQTYFLPKDGKLAASVPVHRYFGPLATYSPTLAPQILALLPGSGYGKPFAHPISSNPERHARLRLVEVAPFKLLGREAFYADIENHVNTFQLPVSVNDVLNNPYLLRQYHWGFLDSLDDLKKAKLQADFQQKYQDPNLLLGNYATPLTRAVSAKSLEWVNLLLSMGADPNLCGGIGCPLDIALHWGARHEAIFEALLKAGASVNQYNADFFNSRHALLARLAYRGDLVMMDRLVKLGAHLNRNPSHASGDTPLIVASLNPMHAEKSVKKLLELGADPVQAAGGVGDDGFTLMDAAEGSKALKPWLKDAILKAAQQRYPLKAWFVQNGQRIPMTSGTIQLKAAPFSIEAELSESGSSGLILASSFDPQWLASVRIGPDPEVFTEGVALEFAAKNGTGSILLSYKMDVGHSFMFYTVPEVGDKTPSIWDAIRSASATTQIYTKHFDEVFESGYTNDAVQAKPKGSTKLAQLKGKTLQFVATIPLGSRGNLYQINPAYMTLVFN